jgi:glycosyltransferase involved in cell wall biosynthesis
MTVASQALSRTHVVLIPSYNPGPHALRTVRAARAAWGPVWVVVDGSTDGSAATMLAEARQDAGLRVTVLASNHGKGGAVLAGLLAAQAEGFTHALACDADGQHPAAEIPAFMAASMAAPKAMILGVPVFDAAAPALRVKGRRVSNWWAGVETSGEVCDSLFGFRVYPIAPLTRIMSGTRWMRRFDFDAEAAVRLSWLGVRAINRPAPVTYLSKAEGGVSHFRYGRDNVLLTWMHVRLMSEFLAWRAWRRSGRADAVA